MSIQPPTGSPRQSTETIVLDEKGKGLLKELSFADVRMLNKILHNEHCDDMRQKVRDSISKYTMNTAAAVGAAAAAPTAIVGAAAGAAYGALYGAVNLEDGAMSAGAAGGGLAAGILPGMAGAATGAVAGGVYGVARSSSKGALSLAGLRVNSFAAEYLNAVASKGLGVEAVYSFINENSRKN